MCVCERRQISKIYQRVTKAHLDTAIEPALFQNYDHCQTDVILQIRASVSIIVIKIYMKINQIQ